MAKFCPKCGLTIKSGTLCENCTEISLDYKPIKIKLCPSNKVFQKGKWNKFTDLKALTQKLVKDTFDKKTKIIQGLEEYPDILLKSGIKKDLQIVISMKGEMFEIPISVEVTTSPGISKQGSTYFEGILQLRHARTEIKEYVKKYMTKNVSKNVFINNVVEKNESVDYYFVTKRHIMPLANKIIRNFGGYASQNAQLFSHNKQTSKDLFRLNVLLVVPRFEEGSVVIVDEKPILIRKMSKIIVGIDLTRGKIMNFTFNEKNEPNILILNKQKTTVTKTHPSLEIMSPEDYQSTPTENPLKLELKVGQKIIVIKHKKFYVIK